MQEGFAAGSRLPRPCCMLCISGFPAEHVPECLCGWHMLAVSARVILAYTRMTGATLTPAGAGPKLRMSPTIAENDLKMKVRTAGKFIEKGHRVKMTVQVCRPGHSPSRRLSSVFFPHWKNVCIVWHSVIMWQP